MRLTGEHKLIMVTVMNKLMPIIRQSIPKTVGDKFVYSASTTIKNNMDLYKFYLILRKVAYTIPGGVKVEGALEKVIVDKSHSAHKEMCKSFEFMVGQNITSDQRFPCVIILSTMSNAEKYRRIEYLEEVLFGQLQHTVSREQSFQLRQELEDLREKKAQDVTVTLNFAVDSIVPKRRMASDSVNAIDTIRHLEARIAKLEKSSSFDVSVQIREKILDLIDENDANFEKQSSKSNNVTTISFIVVTVDGTIKKHYFIASDDKVIAQFKTEREADTAYKALTK